MNLKYYLRGLGLGIVITAIVMGITANGRKEPLTDEAVIIRAKELGMVEDTVLTDYVETAKAETEEAVRKELEEELAKKTAAETGEGETEAASQTQGEAEADDIQSGAAEEAGAEPVIFTVKKGETPYSVSQRLENDGLVPAADDFDKYLVDNGYDRKIVASEYTIPSGADLDTIARIITGHKVEVPEDNLP